MPLVKTSTPAPPAAPPTATPFKAAGDGEDAEEKDPGEAAAESDYDEDDMENSLSLAAIEAERYLAARHE